MKYKIYKILRRILPERIQKNLAESSATQLIRNWFFRPSGVPEAIDGLIEWQDLQFQFAAPYQILYRAQNKGIENSICRLARAILEDTDISIDVGANYGFVTLIMGMSVQPNGLVFSFEIDPYIRGVLNDTIKKNSLSKNKNLTKWP